MYYSCVCENYQYFLTAVWWSDDRFGIDRIIANTGGEVFRTTRSYHIWYQVVVVAFFPPLFFHIFSSPWSPSSDLFRLSLPQLRHKASSPCHTSKPPWWKQRKNTYYILHGPPQLEPVSDVCVYFHTGTTHSNRLSLRIQRYACCTNTAAVHHDQYIIRSVNSTLVSNII